MAKVLPAALISMMLVVSLVVGILLYSPRTGPGTGTGDFASSCPANQYASSEDALGNLTCSTQPTNFSQVGLVGWWPLDEGTGTSAYDMTPNQNTGTLVNSPTWLNGANCKFGDCLNFLNFPSSSVQVMSFGSISNLFPYSFTISVWIKDRSPSTTVEMLLGDRVSSTTWVNAWLETGRNTLAFEIGYNYPTTYTEFECPNTVHDGNWHFLNWVRNIGNSTMYLYVDATLCGSKNDATSPNNVSNNNNVIIGGGTGQQYPVNGTVEDLRIYNRALSATEVSTLYTQGNGALPNPVYPESQNAFTFVSAAAKTCTRTTHGFLYTAAMGFKMNYTTLTSARISITMEFAITTSSNLTDAASFQLSYGTGTPPVCDSSVTGTHAGIQYTLTGYAQAQKIVETVVYAVNLTPNTTYWFDIAETQNTHSTWTFSGPEIVVTELS